MHNNKTLLMYTIVAVALLVAIIFIQMERSSGNEDEFAKCLTEQGFILVGTSWCGYCESQKSLFGDAVQFIDFKNCENDPFCSEYDFKGFPVWVLPDGELVYGVQSLSELSELSGCSYKE